MRHDLFQRCFALLLAGLASACAQGTAAELATLSAQEAAELPNGCAAALANTADADVHWAAVEGDSNAIVIDTPDGSCVDARSQLFSTLAEQHRDNLAQLIRQAFQLAADTWAAAVRDGLVSADPSPHPDMPTDTVSADPSPHPDKDSTGDHDPEDGVVVVVIVVEVVPTPGPPTPAPAGKGD